MGRNGNYIGLIHTLLKVLTINTDSTLHPVRSSARVCVCVFIDLHVAAQSSPDALASDLKLLVLGSPDGG